MLHPNIIADPVVDDLCEEGAYGDWALQEQITLAVQRIRREHRAPAYGIRITNRSESEHLRDYFAALLRPYGLRVSRAPNWRGESWT